MEFNPVLDSRDTEDLDVLLTGANFTHYPRKLVGGSLKQSMSSRMIGGLFHVILWVFLGAVGLAVAAMAMKKDPKLHVHKDEVQEFLKRQEN
jgi:hypothetical protein